MAQYTVRLPPEPAVTRGDQEGHVEMLELGSAFAELPAAQREALVLVGANGFSYGEAATQMAGCGVGTMKSRTSRARSQLRRLLDGEEPTSDHDEAVDVDDDLWDRRAA